MKLVRAGYGSMAEVIKFDARTVIQILYYEEFLNHQELAYMELNKNG